tara:strand:- start:212 stop:856 length:645 start_codon:yes stop_codon:yes gene_type:complete
LQQIKNSLPSLTSIEKSLLIRIFCNNVSKKTNLLRNLKDNSSSSILPSLSSLLTKKYISKRNGVFYLTKLGRTKFKVVLSGGVFDIIHPGHIHTLENSKKLGDVLIVSVARNKTAKKLKNRLPLNKETTRRKLVNSLKFVDLAILGSKIDIFDTVLKIKPDMIALGYDQVHNVTFLRKRAKTRGINVKIKRLDSPMPKMKSSYIVKDKKVFEQI